MARALNPARVDALGWYLHPSGTDIDQCRRLRRIFEEHASVEELATKVEEVFPGSIAEQQRAAAVAATVNRSEDRSELDTGSAAKSGDMDSPVDRFFLVDSAGDFTSLAELQLDGDPETSGNRPKLFLRGTRNSVAMDEVEVKCWKVEFGGKPVVFVQDLQNTWIRLKSPLPLYEQEVGETVLRLLSSLNSIKLKEVSSLNEECMQNHSALLKKLAAQDPELSSLSVIQTTLIKRKSEEIQPSSSKRLKEGEETVEGMDLGLEEGVDEEAEAEEEVEGDEELGESICSICDDGGDLLCCDGPCLRSFHGDCFESRGITYARLKQSFYCRNCSQNQHQCFACGRLGSSQDPAREVFICDVALCGRFYHLHCVSKLLNGKNVSQGFVCPLHSCYKCHNGEGADKAFWLYECRRCPRAWHRACADERIKFGGDEPRAWVIGKTRFLYCMQHKLDPSLGTPKRDHLRFPVPRPEIRKTQAGTLISQKEKPVRPRESKAEIEDPVLAIVEASKQAITRESIEGTLQKPKTVASAPNKNCQMNKLRSLLDALNKACSHVQAGGSIEESRMIFPVEQMTRLEQSKESLKVYLSPLLYGACYSTYGRHFTADEKLEEVVNRLCWYVCHGDTVADLCCGDNTFSRKLSKRVAEMKIVCRFKNYDLFPPSDTFCFERRDYLTLKKAELGNPSGLIMGLNPPFGVKGQTASRFAKFVASFHPKVIVLIAPKETERLEGLGYVLTWEDKHLLKGNAFYLPGSTDVDGKAIIHDNIDAPVLSLWSRADWKDCHKRIAEERGHLRFGVETCSLDVVSEPFADFGKNASAASAGETVNLLEVPEVSSGSGQKEQATGGWIDPDFSPESGQSGVSDTQLSTQPEDGKQKRKTKEVQRDGAYRAVQPLLFPRGHHEFPRPYPPPYPGYHPPYPYLHPHFQPRVYRPQQIQEYRPRAYPPHIQDHHPRGFRPSYYPYEEQVPWPQHHQGPPFQSYIARPPGQEVHLRGPRRQYFPARGNNRHFFR